MSLTDNWGGGINGLLQAYSGRIYPVAFFAYMTYKAPRISGLDCPQNWLSYFLLSRLKDFKVLNGFVHHYTYLKVLWHVLASLMNDVCILDAQEAVMPLDCIVPDASLDVTHSL
jgi:hypothetical protein